MLHTPPCHVCVCILCAGLAGPGSVVWMVLVVIVSICWWIIVLWNVLLIMGGTVWSACLYILRESINTLLGAYHSVLHMCAESMLQGHMQHKRLYAPVDSRAAPFRSIAKASEAERAGTVIHVCSFTVLCCVVLSRVVSCPTDRYGPQPPVSWLPSSNLPCPGECLNLTLYTFINSDLANSVSTEQPDSAL